jgi:hypothetical protein
MPKRNKRVALSTGLVGALLLAAYSAGHFLGSNGDNSLLISDAGAEPFRKAGRRPDPTRSRKSTTRAPKPWPRAKSA